jgi:hypothetical protein
MLSSILSLNVCTAYAGIFPASNYDDCILDGIKSAKTDLAVRAVYQACRNKFPESGGEVVKDCSTVWSGKKFIKGYPENIYNYQKAAISETTVTVYFPKDLSKDSITKIMQSKIEDVKKICPYF